MKLYSTASTILLGIAACIFVIWALHDTSATRQVEERQTPKLREEPVKEWKRVNSTPQKGRRNLGKNEVPNGEDRLRLAKSVKEPVTSWKSFADRWQELKDVHLDDETKASLQLTLVSQACRSGFGKDVVAFVREEIGEGTKRNNFVKIIFRESNFELGTLEATLRGLSKREVRSALSGLEDCFSQLRDPQGLKQHLAYFSPELQAAALTGISKYLASSATEQISLVEKLQLVENIISDLPDNQKQEEFSIILSSLSSKNPLDDWKTLNELGILQRDSIKEGSLNHLIDMMLRKDLDGGLDLIQKSHQHKYLSIAFANSLRKDSKSAEAWLESTQSSLSKEELDGIWAGYAQYHGQDKSRGNAREYLQRISDDKLREEATRDIAEYEARDVLLDARKSPATTVTAVLENSEGYNPSSIRIAISEWIKKDPDAAWSFYQHQDANASSKAEYFAAAYSSIATKQGDSESAAAWLAKVKDPRILADARSTK